MTKRTRNSKLVARLLCATSLIGAFYTTPVLAADGDVAYDGTNLKVEQTTTTTAITTVTIGNTSINASGLKTTGTFTTDGEAKFNDVLTVNGITKLNDALTINGTTQVNNALTVTGDTSLANATIDGKLGVTGDTALKNTSVNGTLGVSGLASFGNSPGDTTTIQGGIINASTSATIGTNTVIDTTGIQTNKVTTNDLTVTNNFSIPTLTVTDSMTVTNKAIINGVIIGETANEINAKTYRAGTSSFAENTLTIDANNALTDAGLKASTATIAGKTTTDSLEVTNDAAVGGNFNVTGDTTLNKTTINGDLDAQKITSKVDANNYGTWNGNEFTLFDGTSGNTTNLTAGSAIFKGAAGVDGGNTTTINGGTITTDTLEVSTIKLKNHMVDDAGTTLEISETGSLMAASGNFKVDKDGNMTNTTGTTELTTDATNGIKATADSASLEIADGQITNKVGTDVSSELTDTSITNKAGDTTVITKDSEFSVAGSAGNGLKIDTATGETTFTGNNTHYGSGSQETTVINGNTITTGKLTTDQLVITGQGDADGTGTGSIMLGGDGSINSNIKDGSNETSFETKADGITSLVTDGTNEANVFTKADKVETVVGDGTDTANFVVEKNSVTTIVSDGTNRADITIEKDEITNYIRNEATGESLAATSLADDGFAVAQKGYNDIELGNGDVKIDTSAGTFTNKGTGGEVKLSDLGNLDKDLDSQLKARSEYTNNQTAVGAINAEAGIRAEEDLRLNNRIDNLSDRVDKVGAMSAAMASLRTMGYDPNCPSEFSIGMGHYKGKTGIAMGLFHHPNRDVMLNFSLSTASGETMGGMGATWKFGHKSPDKLLQQQREIEAKKKLAAAEKLAAAQKLAEEARERAAYAAKVAQEAATAAKIAQQDADRTAAKIAH